MILQDDVIPKHTRNYDRQHCVSALWCQGKKVGGGKAGNYAIMVCNLYSFLFSVLISDLVWRKAESHLYGSFDRLGSVSTYIVSSPS